MALDNLDFASSAYDRWLQYNDQALRTARVPAAATDPSTGRVLTLDTAPNRQLLQRLLHAG